VEERYSQGEGLKGGKESLFETAYFKRKGDKFFNKGR
jgi:hypothetical protein